MNLKQFSLSRFSLSHVKRFSCSAIVLILSCVAIFAQDRDKTSVTVNGATITIDYGRPALKGRDMLSQLGDGQVWRLGMNAATQIETSKNLTVGGKQVPAGKYTLWLKKRGTGFLLCFHPKTGVWGAPPLTEGYIAELPLKSEKANDSAEQLVITLSDNKGGALVKIQWGKDVLTGTLRVG